MRLISDHLRALDLSPSLYDPLIQPAIPLIQDIAPTREVRSVLRLARAEADWRRPILPGIGLRRLGGGRGLPLTIRIFLMLRLIAVVRTIVFEPREYVA